MDYSEILFHVHSKHSYDSLMEPRKIVEIVKRMGYKGVVIVDHGNIRGGVEAKKYESEGFRVIIGGEYHSRFGDIVGIGLKRNISSRDPFAIVKEIKEQCGKVVWAHPCRTYLMPRGNGKKKPLPPSEFIRSLDYIETHNAQTRPGQNREAKDIAKQFDIAELSGLDAHFYFELKRNGTGYCFYGLLGYLGTFFISKFKKGVYRNRQN